MNAKRRGADEIVVRDCRPLQAVHIGFYGLVLVSLAIRNPPLVCRSRSCGLLSWSLLTAGRAISRSPTPKGLLGCAYACHVPMEAPGSSGTRWSGRLRRGTR
jgi:hypothetical protein